MDFVADQLVNGRKVRCLTVVDDFTRECLATILDTSITGNRVARELDAISPNEVPLDRSASTTDLSSPVEFSIRGHYSRGVRLQFIRPGRPVENVYIESFNGKFRDECLNEHWFTSMDHARVLIEAWRHEYNQERPHSSRGNATPAEFAKAWLSRAGKMTSVQPADSGSRRY
jgi:putative transposase